MPMNATRYGVAPVAMGNGINALDIGVANASGTGVSVSGQVQVTGVLLLALLAGVVIIARAMGGVLE